jgi:hypothetical protein
MVSDALTVTTTGPFTARISDTFTHYSSTDRSGTPAPKLTPAIVDRHFDGAEAAATRTIPAFPQEPARSYHGKYGAH